MHVKRPNAGCSPAGPVVDHDRAHDRLAEEQARIEAIKAAATPPDACGPDIPAAPARGAVRVFDPYVQVGSGNPRHAGYRGPGEARPRSALMQVSALDLIERDALLRHRRATGGDDGFAPVFTAGQRGAAELYRALVERHAAGGMRCASVEARVSGGAGGGGFADAFLAEGRRIERMRRAIGPGSALCLRRIRPSDRGSRRSIPDAALVDAVVLGDQMPRAVLRAHGWARSARVEAAVVRALVEALDRMAQV